MATSRTISSNTFGDNVRINLGDIIHNNYTQAPVSAAAYTVQFSEPDVAPGLILGDLPPKTDRFFGRDAEISQVSQCLQSEAARSGSRGVAVTGLSGSGKTQVVLELIQRHKSNYAAILWIDASSPTRVEESFMSCASAIYSTFAPSDAPSRPQALVIQWLRTTRHQNWLMVIDGLDDLISNRDLVSTITKIPGGSICVTSTHQQTATAIRLQSINLNPLDKAASRSLLLWRAFDVADEPEERLAEWARHVLPFLDKFPLALELAGILVHEGIISVNTPPETFETKYLQLTQFQVGAGGWAWDRSDSMFGMLDALFKSLQPTNRDSSLLLAVCSIYGQWEVPVALLHHLKEDGEDHTTDLKRLSSLIDDEISFNLAMRALAQTFLAKLRKDANGTMTGISFHSSVSRWRAASIGSSDVDWILSASVALSRHVQGHYAALSTESEFFGAAHQFLTPAKRCLDLIDRNVRSQDIELSGQHAERFYVVSLGLSRVYLAIGDDRVARRLLQFCMDYLHAIKKGTQNKDAELYLNLSLGVCCHRMGDLSEAEIFLTQALQLAENIHGHMSDTATKIYSRLQIIRSKQEATLSHQKRALIASTGPKRLAADDLDQHDDQVQSGERQSGFFSPEDIPDIFWKKSLAASFTDPRWGKILASEDWLELCPESEIRKALLYYSWEQKRKNQDPSHAHKFSPTQGLLDWTYAQWFDLLNQADVEDVDMALTAWVDAGGDINTRFHDATGESSLLGIAITLRSAPLVAQVLDHGAEAGQKLQGRCRSAFGLAAKLLERQIRRDTHKSAGCKCIADAVLVLEVLLLRGAVADRKLKYAERTLLNSALWQCYRLSDLLFKQNRHYFRHNDQALLRIFEQIPDQQFPPVWHDVVDGWPGTEDEKRRLLQTAFVTCACSGSDMALMRFVSYNTDVSARLFHPLWQGEDRTVVRETAALVEAVRGRNIKNLRILIEMNVDIYLRVINCDSLTAISEWSSDEESDGLDEEDIEEKVEDAFASRLGNTSPASDDDGHDSWEDYDTDTSDESNENDVNDDGDNDDDNNDDDDSVASVGGNDPDLSQHPLWQDLMDITNCSPLSVAVLLGYHDVAELLLQNGAPVNDSVGERGDKLIDLAFCAQDKDMVDLFLQFGATLDHQGR